MAWAQSSSYNNGYPFYIDTTTDPDTLVIPVIDNFIGEYPNTCWIWSDNYNDSYPFIISTSTPSLQRYYKILPYNAWRISGTYNDGYPYIHWWVNETEAPEPTPDETLFNNKGHVSGSQQYNPTTWGQTTGSDIPTDGKDAHDDFKETSFQSQSMANCTNAYVISSSELIQFRTDLVTYPLEHFTTASVVSNFFGGNIYNCVVMCKMFPFSLNYSSSNLPPTTLGGVEIGTAAFNIANDLTKKLEFGTLDLNVEWAYQISNAEFYIYLPYSGIYSLPIVGNETIRLTGVVDLTTGELVYFVFANGQQIFSASGKVGADIPINLSQGQMLSNAVSNVMGIASHILPMIASAADPLLGIMAEGVSETTGKLLTPKKQNVDMTCKFNGGLGATLHSQNARIIVKQPIRINNAENLVSTLGYKADKVTLIKNYGNGAFIKTRNYACANTNILDSEKMEIEKLLNSGVFI